MKAFAVFDGGGVKGAALAGCLSAAEAQGIEIEGYGGTSAGALIALLASVGYKGKQIRDLLLDEVRPLNMLDDEGTRLIGFQTCQREVIRVVSGKQNLAMKMLAVVRLLRREGKVVEALWRDGGIYDGRKLQGILEQKILEKFPALRTNGVVSFRELERAGAKRLKIVAADLSSRTAAVFSADDGTYGESVVGAAVASASYPFVFKPIRVLGDRYLTDGGLASNLPAFLYAKEYRETRYPILAFDLVAPKVLSTSSGFPSICEHLLGTALEASDHLLAEAIPGVFRIPISIPAEITTLRFDLSAGEIRGLFDIGYRAATEYLSSFERLKNTQRAGELLKRQLWAIYGPPARYQPLLWAITKMLEERTEARGLRAHIMVPTGRGTRIVAYCYGQRPEDADTDLELDELAGYSGKAIETGRIVVADMEVIRRNIAAWGLSAEQQSRVPIDRRTSVSLPIFLQREGTGRSGELSVATLSVDSSTPLEETKWATGKENVAEKHIGVSRSVYDTMREWSEVIARILYPEW